MFCALFHSHCCRSVSYYVYGSEPGLLRNRASCWSRRAIQSRVELTSGGGSGQQFASFPADLETYLLARPNTGRGLSQGDTTMALLHESLNCIPVRVDHKYVPAVVSGFTSLANETLRVPLGLLGAVQASVFMNEPRHVKRRTKNQIHGKPVRYYRRLFASEHHDARVSASSGYLTNTLDGELCRPPVKRRVLPPDCSEVLLRLAVWAPRLMDRPVRNHRCPLVLGKIAGPAQIRDPLRPAKARSER